MPSIKTLAATAAIAGLAAAAPTQQKKRGASYQFTQVHAGSKPAVNPAAVKAKALSKFNIAVPASLAAAASSGSVSAIPEQSEEYLIQVTAGAGNLNLDLDTGSSDLWVFGSQTPDNSGHNLYSPGPNAQQAQGETWNISYGDGSSASGVVYNDAVTIGGVTATSQAVEVATQISSEFQQSPGDGLIGFAFSQLNTIQSGGQADPQNTFFDNVTPNLDQPVLTALLKQNQPGTYGLGSIDSSYNPNFVDVDNSNGFWEFSVDSNSVTNKGFSAIADTGTTLLLIDQDIADAYWKQVSGSQYDSQQGAYTYPCGANLPDFGLTIGGQQINVSGATIAWLSSGGQCIGGISTNEGEDFAILGDVFLQNVYAVFQNGQSPQIGFAQQ